MSSVRRKVTDMIMFECLNGCELTWEMALDALNEQENSGEKLPFPYTVLKDVGVLLAESPAIVVQELAIFLNFTNDDQLDVFLDIVLEKFPVMLAYKKGEQSALINIHELILQPETLSALFEEKQREVADCNDREQEEQQQQPVLESVKERRQKKRGQPSIVSKFPEIVGRITDFLKQHGYAAHNRRRTTTGTGQGVTLGQIKQHLLSTVEGLAEHGISRDTIHLMMAPPRKGTKRAGRYNGLVDARVPAKKN